MAGAIDLYARYLLERENTHLYSEEDCFITYEFCDGYAYIIDMYVAPESRNAGTCRRISEKVEAIIKSKGYSTVVGSVCTSTNDWERSLTVVKLGGYEEYKREDDMIYLVKRI